MRQLLVEMLASASGVSSELRKKSERGKSMPIVGSWIVPTLKAIAVPIESRIQTTTEGTRFTAVFSIAASTKRTANTASSPRLTRDG